MTSTDTRTRNTLTIARRLWLPPLVIGLAAVAMGIGAAWTMKRVDAESAQALRAQQAKLGDAYTWSGLTEANAARVVAVLQSVDPGLDGRLKPDVDATSARISTLQKGLEASSVLPEEKALLDTVGAKRKAYIDLRNQARDLKKAGQEEAALQALKTQVLPAVASYLDAQRDFVQHEAARSEALRAEAQAPFIPAPLDEVVAAIRQHRPDVVFAPHVETSAGMMLPDDYLRAVADATHEVGGLFVLDCIASGTIWVDMDATGVDVLVSAPQKGWSASPCCAMVMMSAAARDRIEGTTSTSFSCDLKKWLQIMQAYEGGGHAYHATMPTDGLVTLRNVMRETEAYGFDKVKAEQEELGARVRQVLEAHGFPSVAAAGFQAPGVVVSFTTDDGIKTGAKFAAAGLQVAAGVPLACDERPDYKAFRIGLFGLDKLHNVARTVATLEKALDQVG